MKKLPLNRTATGLVLAAGLALAVYQFGLRSWRRSWGITVVSDDKVNWPFPSPERAAQARDEGDGPDR